jgi:hypothetical protein
VHLRCRKRGTDPGTRRRQSRRLWILADNGLARSGNDRQARIVERAAVELVLNRHHRDEHDGRGDAAKHKTNDSKAATVGHDPLPQCPLRCVVAGELMPVQAKRLTLGESLSDGSIDKPAAHL